MMNFLVKQAHALAIENPFQTGPLAGQTGQAGISQIVAIVINILFAAAALLFLIMFFVGGIAWITAGGDPKNVAAARSRLTNAFIGLVIVMAAFAITQLLFGAFGLDSFLEITQ